MPRTLCGIQLDRSPAFQVVDGTEKYKVIDLVTGGEYKIFDANGNTVGSFNYKQEEV